MSSARSLLLTVVFLIVPALVMVGTADGQGIGDRNRPAESGDGRYTIQGKIYLPDGKPAVNAVVRAASADLPGSSTNADADGTFQFSGLGAGNYRLLVELDGFAGESESLTIDRFSPVGSTFKLVFHLRSQPRAAQPRAEVISANPLLADVPETSYEKFRKGLDRLEKNDPDGAIDAFDQAIKLYPKFAAAYFERGYAFLKKNDADKALESFVAAVSIQPDYLEAKYSVGYAQFLRKNYEVAAAVFGDVLKQKSDMPEAAMYLGVSLLHLRNLAAAEAFLKRAASKGGDKTALAHRYLGGMYVQQMRNAEAAAELQKYLDLVPKAPDADRLKETIAGLKKKF